MLWYDQWISEDIKREIKTIKPRLFRRFTKLTNLCLVSPRRIEYNEK